MVISLFGSFFSNKILFGEWVHFRNYWFIFGKLIFGRKNYKRYLHTISVWHFVFFYEYSSICSFHDIGNVIKNKFKESYRTKRVGKNRR